MLRDDSSDIHGTNGFTWYPSHGRHTLHVESQVFTPYNFGSTAGKSTHKDIHVLLYHLLVIKDKDKGKDPNKSKLITYYVMREDTPTYTCTCTCVSSVTCSNTFITQPWLTGSLAPVTTHLCQYCVNTESQL